MKIRPATLDDMSFLISGLTELVEHTRRSGDVYFVNLDADYQAGFEAWFTQFLNDETVLVFIAEHNGQTAGFVMGQITRPFLPFSQIKRIGEISICWVGPALRGQGIAAQLVAHLEANFAKQGIEYVELQYIVGNIEAERFWDRHQYKPFRIQARKQINV